MAFGAAFANVAVVLKTGVSVSHLTGDISKLAMDISHGSAAVLEDVAKVAAAAISFFLGAMLSGFLIHHPCLDFARPYGRAIMGIGMLFVLSGLLIVRYPVVGIGLAAFACGLQNSLSTRYQGIILRTTHLTGLVTDCGSALGMRLRGYDVPSRLYVVPALLGLAFLVGGVCSGLMFSFFQIEILTFTGCAYMIAGLGWSVAKRILFARFLG